MKLAIYALGLVASVVAEADPGFFYSTGHLNADIRGLHYGLLPALHYIAPVVHSGAPLPYVVAHTVFGDVRSSLVDDAPQGPGATEPAIIGLSFDEAPPVPPLFSINTGLPTTDIEQCKGDGIDNCQVVNINNDVLDTISVNDQVNLLPGLDLLLTLKRSPTESFGLQRSSSASFVFTVGKYGEASITRGNNGSVYGSIKPDSGNVDYFLESCGEGCNVLYQRDSGYFNQFKD